MINIFERHVETSRSGLGAHACYVISYYIKACINGIKFKRTRANLAITFDVF